jgi:hypothetical protein
VRYATSAPVWGHLGRETYPLTFRGRGVGRGQLVLGALVVVWPLGAWLVVGLRRLPQRDRWRPFAGAAVVATVLALAALVGVGVLFLRGGTTEAMWGLGGQVVAAACLLGALVSGVIAGAVRSSTGGGAGRTRHAHRPERR